MAWFAARLGAATTIRKMPTNATVATIRIPDPVVRPRNTRSPVWLIRASLTPPPPDPSRRSLSSPGGGVVDLTSGTTEWWADSWPAAGESVAVRVSAADSPGSEFFSVNDIAASVASTDRSRLLDRLDGRS